MVHQSLSRVAIALLVLTSAGFAQNYFYENFNNNNAGWTPGNEWAIGPCAASSGQQYGGPDPASDADGVPGGGVAGVVLGGNASIASTHTAYYLTSPFISVGGLPSVYLNFSRWLNSDYTPYMQNTIDVFDGTSWVNLFTTGGYPGVQDSTWTTCLSYNVTPYANSNFQVRFGFSIGSSGVFSVSSWNIDNVSIDGVPNAGTIPGQPNSPQATLDINGVPPSPCGGHGVVIIPTNGSINFNWQGPAGQPVVLFWSPTLNPGGVSFPCFGSADIGTPLGFGDVAVVFDGTHTSFPGSLFVLNSSGSAYQSFSIPAFPSGTSLGNVQGAVFQPSGGACPFVLTKAWAMSVQ